METINDKSDAKIQQVSKVIRFKEDIKCSIYKILSNKKVNYKK
jgi:hypothetical protein